MQYNTIIIGGGVAGLTAGLYLGRARVKTLIIESRLLGGQTALLNKVDNYPSVLDTTGFDIVQNLIKQVKLYDIDFVTEQVIDVSKNSHFIVKTNKNIYTAENIIIATGAKTNALGLTNEKKFTGRGVSYCVSCDANFFKNKPVALVGNDKEAIQDIKYLHDIASKIYWIVPNKEIKEINQLSELANLEVIKSSEIVDLIGEDVVSGVKIYDKAKNKTFSIEVEGLFVQMGRHPDTSWLNVDIKKDKNGYLVVNKNCQTSCKGIFACGDIVSRNLKQIVVACSDGAIASSYIISNR